MNTWRNTYGTRFRRAWGRASTNSFAGGIANEIPTVTARRLGINILVQLGQPKNRVALKAIDAFDAQIFVAQKIKEYRSLSTPTLREEVSFLTT